MMDKIVALSRQDHIAIMTISNPPVNALSQTVRQGLVACIHAINQDDTLDGVVISGGTGRFIAGADIKEMNLPPDAPFLPDIVAAIEAIKIPVVAAIDGAALGGGLEIALACDLRLVSSNAKLGLTETNLGIIPGAGGTQRLSRLTGIAKAITMIGEAQILSAEQAVKAGIADALVTSNILETAIQRAKTAKKRRVSQLAIPAGRAEDIEAAETSALKKAKGLPAVTQAIKIIRDSADNNFETGLRQERESFLTLRESIEAKALRHLFFAERQSSKIPGIEPKKGQDITKAAIVGAGTMGSGIAVALADAGIETLVLEMDDAAALRGQERVEALYDAQVKRGRLSETEREKRLARIGVTANWNHVADCQLVIEAAFEDIDVKKTIFQKLATLTRPDCILASNTSYLDLDKIASFSKYPENVVGLHFFSPAHIMKLLEIVRAQKTSIETLSAALAFAKKIKKIPVIAGNCDGFIGNRIYAVYRRHAEYLVEDGAMPWEVDAALEEYGFAMGIFAVSDLSGLDIALAMRKRRAATRPKDERYVTLADELCGLGRLGRKTNGGWYDYDDKGKRMPSPLVAELIEKTRKENGISTTKFSKEAIQRRLLAVMVNEGAKELEEHIAQRPSDIDLAFVNGYGFPRLKGGPMFAADETGLQAVLDEVEQAFTVGGAGSEPAALLRDYARNNQKFDA